MSQFGESCRSPSLFHQKHSFCEPCYSFAPHSSDALHGLRQISSNMPSRSSDFFLLGLRASKSLGLPHPSLSAPQRRRKTPTWQMEDLLGRKGEDMKTKSGKKYHSSNARPSATAAARRGSSSSSDSGEATWRRRRRTSCLLSPLSSFHSRIPLKLIRLAPLSVPSLIPGHIRHAERDATATEDEDDDDALLHFLSRLRFFTLLLAMPCHSGQSLGRRPNRS